MQCIALRAPETGSNEYEMTSSAGMHSVVTAIAALWKAGEPGSQLQADDRTLQGTAEEGSR